MSGLNYLKLGSTLSNICNTTQLDDATKCHYAFKNFWGEPWPIRSWMSSIMEQIKPEHLELFALEFRKIAAYVFFYILSSTSIYQSAPNLVKMYVIIRSQMSSIMDLIGPELSDLSVLELENLPYLTLFTL